MEEQNNNLQELEELRSQVAEFKNRIEQQDIVSQQLLREAMRGRVSWIKSYNVWISVIGILLLPLLIPVFRVAGCSWGPIVFVAVMIVFDVVFTLCNVSTIRNKYFFADDVVTVRRRLLAFKKRSKLQMLIDVPLIVLWLIWLSFDISKSDGHFGAGIVIGGLIGLAIAFVIYLREMRSLNDAVRQIDIFTEK